MNKKGFYWLILIVIITATGCQRRLSEYKTLMATIDGVPTRIRDARQPVSSNTKVFVSNWRNYDIFFSKTDYRYIVSSLTDKPFSPGTITGATFLTKNGDRYFGAEHSLTRSVQSATRAEEPKVYIPEEIYLLSPACEDGILLGAVDNFILQWNKDEKNDNGVIVIVEWAGRVLFGAQHPNVIVRRIDLFPDTGECVLPREMFDGIPDTAYCHMTIMRGNAQVYLSDGYSFTEGGESHAGISFAAIKHLTDV